jgi:hypothetical protein
MSDHFTELQWLGFVLNCCPEEAARAIEQHLQLGCCDCQQAQVYWSTLQQCMTEEERVPDWAVERVLALPQQSAPAGLPKRAKVRLVFDNMSTPMPAYLRSTGGYSRHCVYSLSESASLEVLVERVSRQQGWSLVGQILDDDGRGWEECRIQLTDERECWQETSTNQAGEFAFAHAGQGSRLRLELEAGDRRWEIAPVLMP